MGFLKKSNAPSELPDLAINSLPDALPGVPTVSTESARAAPTEESKALPKATVQEEKAAVENVVAPKAEEEKEVSTIVPSEPPKTNPAHEEIKKLVEAHEDVEFDKGSFFDEVLEDINGGIAESDKLEEWYKKKFVDEDVVSNMKGYWEGNKADIIIKSFGAEYKRQIKDKIKVLQDLEEDWREIYFRLIKKEEEMKKEERELKEIVSEFVNLCKRREQNGKKK